MKNTKDDGVSNVVGEMLLLAIAIVLVAVFAVSFFGLLPGERAEVIELGVDSTYPQDATYSETDVTAFLFPFVWGDFLPSSDLQVIVYDEANPTEQLNVINTRVVNANTTPDQWVSRQALDYGFAVAVCLPKVTETGEHTYKFIFTCPEGILDTKEVRWVVTS